MFDRLSHELRLACGRARLGALALRDARIGTEHLALGLLEVEGLPPPEGGPDALRARVTAAVEVARPGREGVHPSRALPFTPDALRAFELARDSAVAFGAAEVGVEHLLQGILAEPDGLGGQILRELALRAL